MDSQASTLSFEERIPKHTKRCAGTYALVEEIVQCFWRLHRARAIEAENFNLSCAGADPVIGFNSGHIQFDTMRRYMTTIERAYHRALQQLERTQAIRRKTEPEVGFVSQKAEKLKSPLRLIEMTNSDRRHLPADNPDHLPQIDIRFHPFSSEANDPAAHESTNHPTDNQVTPTNQHRR